MPQSENSEIAALEAPGLAQLRTEWGRHFSEPVPAVRSVEFLRGLIAWRRQAANAGGLTADTRRRLRRLAEAYERDPDYTPSPTLDLKPGTVLEREWHGVRHRVEVLDDGFAYDGAWFGSLSEVAHHITGTRWNGRLFFGLKGKAKAIKKNGGSR